MEKITIVKTPKINFREPNIDRFAELMVIMNKLGFVHKSNIKNISELYKDFLARFDYYPYDANEDIKPKRIMFINECSEEVYFDRLFKKDESFEAIHNRIDEIVFWSDSNDSINNIEYGLNDSCKAILKNVIMKMNLDIDQIQAIIDLSCCIALSEKSKEMLVQHIAEAIGYINYKFNENII